MAINCFKLTLIIGFVFCGINLIADIISMCYWLGAVETYAANAEWMIDNGATSNFNATSQWFITLSEEYDSLSDFDKENVYCDVHQILASPDEHTWESEGYFAICFILAVSSALAIVMVTCMILYGKTLDLNYKDDMEMFPGNSEIRDRAARRPDTQPKTTEVEDNIWEFRAMSFLLFFVTGPFLAVVWLMILRHNETTGLTCQAAFYDCGKSGSCDMGDLMVPVALNSSVIAYVAVDGFLAASFFAGTLNFLFVFISGLLGFICVRECDVWSLFLPIFQVVFVALPFCWVYLLDDKLSALGTLEGLLVIICLPGCVVCGGFGIHCYRNR